ncbi:MAG: TauD/TfdA family dioxygenase [Rhodospirillaceae bacterium]|nr:TauD/TfdA family dioxygenase [Rhodospirillaceae bacterium]
MTEQISAEITDPGAWLGPDIQAGDEDWIRHLSAEALADLDAALRHVQKAGLQIPFGKEDFPLNACAAELAALLPEVQNGLGFRVLRGIPRDKYSDAECELLYWGIGVHIGSPVSQNDRGHLLGHVLDEDRSYDDPSARGYQTAQRMDFHCDLLPVDVLGLFCLHQAKSGGESHLVSSLTVHNVLRRERPDLLDVTYQPFHLDWRDEEPDGEQPWYAIPMFSAADGQVTSRFTSRQYLQSCERFGTEYTITDAQTECLDLVQQIANRPELQVSFRLQEGDIQLVNNHTTMHARDAFEDYDDPALKRHLLRMWIALSNDMRRPLSPELDCRYKWVEAGGIPLKESAAG